MRVIACDDDPDFLHTLAEHLRTQGIAVVAVTSGFEALTRLRDEPFDALVLDLVMPGLNGIQVARRARALGHGARIPIVMISDLSDVSRLHEVPVEGANVYVHKFSLFDSRHGLVAELLRATSRSR